MNTVLTIIAIVLCAFAYRLRGGGYVILGSTTVCRIIWALAFQAAYIIVSCAEASIAALVISPLIAFLSMYVPHGFCQCMGRWSVPQKKWPAFFLPTLTRDQWILASPFQRGLYDAAAMGGVAFFRCLIVFGPLFAVNYYVNPLTDVMPYFLATGTLCVLQPLGYVIGWFMPWSFTSAMTARTTGWGEFFNGAAWAMALAWVGTW